MSHGRKSSKRDPQECPVTENQKPRRCSMKDVKKKKSHNGTWSKELIHKIVQQKNKLHKLHVKSNKHVQFSLVTERLFPPAKSHTFGEYDYISDSDDEADLAVKKQMANGRLKYNFNRDHQGRAGRMKEKETVWRMGEATRFQLHNKDLRSNNKETFNRVRRRSSQSSTSSDQSTSISSETGSSPKSIEHTDSENEQETMLRRKNVNSSNQNIAVERNFVRPLYKESLLETFSKGPKRFGSAKFLLAGSKVFPSKVNDSKYIGDNEKSQQSQEMDDKEDNSRKSTEGLLLYEDEHESTCHKEGIVINISQENYTNDLLLDVDNVPIPFSSLHEDTIHFQTKKANVSTCIPAEHNTEVTLNYTDAGLKFIKEGICNDHETFSMPVGCYSGDSTENEKNHEAYNSESQQFPEHEDLPDLYGNNLFPKAQHVAPSEIGKLYLNQSNPSSTNNGSFEHKCSQLPTYSTDNNEHKVSSTLSFDSSSIFSELPMSDFEAPLFNSIQPTKDTYVGYTCSNEQSRKPTHYEQQYPQFLQQKNWGLNEGPSLMANTIIAPFPVVENQSTEKYIEQMPASSGPMALALSDSLGDYNASFINISEDELEIKRLVTELENQLQTNNMHNNVSSQACPKNQTNADLSSTTVPFPDTTENAVESYSKNLYLEDFSSLSNPTHVEQNLQECQALAKVEDNCGSLKNPWTCSVQFDSFPSSIQCHNQSSSLESFNHTDTDSQYPETLNDVTVTEKLDSLSSNHRSPSVLPDACLHDIDTQSTCQAFSASTLIRDTLVTAETLLSGKEENEMVIENDTQQNEPDNLFLKKEQLEERFDDPPELEPFQSVSELNSEFSAHDCDVPVLNRTSPPLKNEKSPGGVLSDPGFRDEIPSSAVVEEYNLNCQKVSEKEGPVDISSSRDQQKKDKRKPAPLDMPVLEKEESAITEKSSTNKDSTENPLQQLQLFVARTAKNNEEEMLMPCFPVLLATSSHVSPQADIECDSSSTPDSKLTSKAAKSSDIIEIEDVPDLAETSMPSANIKQMHPLANEKTSASSESLSNEAQNEVTQSHFTENECSRLDVINIDHRETAHDSDPLPQSNDTENLVREQAKMDDKMKALMKTDRNKAALTMDINQQSTYAFDDQAFAVFPQNTPTVPCMGITSPHKSNTGYQLLCGLTLEVIDNQVSQEKNIDASVFTSPGNQKDVINNILQEKELIMTNGEICKEASPVRQDKSDASVFPDEISGQFPLHFNQQKSLHKRNIDYQTQLPEMSSPNPHSPLDFDLFAHLPLKTSISKSDGYCQSSENIMCPAEEEPTPSSPNCPIKVSNCKDQSEKHSLVGPDVLLYLGEDRCLTSSLDMGRKPLTKNEGPVSPSAKGNICFCNELVCPHYKQPETCSAADAILQCGSLPLSNGYPIFAETECQKYSTLSNELFTDHIQTVADPPLCCQKDDGLKWDSQKGAHISHAFPNENHSAALVCDLINITESSYVDLSNPQISLAADGRIAQASTICISAETHSSVADTERKCPNDMDSVIDGVLRILDCDKSKEILESIGIPSRNSPLKEKKSIEQSLICDICSMSFRSKPGLSRHKAAKHNMKNDGTMIAHKDGASENGKNKDNSSGNIEHDVLQNFISDSVSQKPTTELLGQESNIQIQYLISEEQQRPISTKSKEESNGPSDDTSGVEVTGRKRLIGRIKKRKIKTLSNKTTDSQVPSDDILNILKTNILKAIGQSNGFTSVEEKTTWTQPADTDKAQEGTKAIVLETYSAKQHYVEEENVKGNILDIGINKELLAGELKWAKDLKSQIENTATNICDTEHATRLSTNAETSVIEKTLLYPPNNCVEGHSTVPESRLGQKDLPVSIVPKHVEPDLHSLFDDDKNFSQLFPRDDHFIRRKCTRVYGKKTKRQSPPFKTDFKNIDLVEPNSLTQAKNNTYEYGNILVDENLVGNKGSLGHTEPDSEFRSISPVKERISIDDSGLLPFLPQSQAIENLTGRSLSEESQDGKDLDISFEDALFKSPEVSHSSFTERSSRMQDSELEEVFDCKMGEETSLPEFPTIDMKMLSAKFDMRELSFFSACGDDSDQSDADRPDTTRKTEKHKRNGRNKMEDKRQSRTRGNVNIKTKEKQYKCKVCFQWFLTLGELDFHKLTHNPSPPPTCYMCVQRKFSSREQLRDHLKDKHAKNKAGLWICGMCLKEISDVWMYNEHLREHATQFARKGQAQKTVMGIPGCFAEDNLVRTFLSTFIYRTPAKSSKTSEPEDKSPSGKKQDHKDHKDEEEHVTEKEQEGSTSNASNTSVHVKVSVSPLLETIQKTESVQKNPAIHPHCKDPSRDCHHCGKQFPKPFKLQRHLVVHSLQKIYLCHKCPKSYQEVHELRNHLNSEHQLSEETEIKHTTLYACELCADVMHVIKKSFICSTCNYTFSKKEQYDRHMEKHLIGGSMTFKFRGVMRPCFAGKEVKDKIKEPSSYEGMPPSKKQKTYNYSETPPDITCADIKNNKNQSPSVQHVLSPAVILDKEVKDIAETKEDIAVKTEDMAGDVSCSILPLHTKVGNPIEEVSNVADNEEINVSQTEITLSTLPTTANNDLIIQDTESTQEPQPPALYLTNPVYMDTAQKSPLQNQEKDLAEVSDMGSPLVMADDLLCHLLSREPAELFASNNEMSTNMVSNEDMHCPQTESVVVEKEDALKSQTLNGAVVTPVLSKVKSITSDGSGSVKDLKGPKKNKGGGQINKSVSGGEGVSKSSAPKLKPVTESYSVSKDSSVCTLKETVGAHHKVSKKEPIVYLPKHNSVDSVKMDDKASTALTNKVHPKKRKEHKISGHKGGSASRENMAGEVKKKKSIVGGSGKSDTSGGGVKKPDYTSTVSAFSEIKDETLCSRLTPKPHTGISNGQLKKMVLDTHNQKKATSRSSNGEYKCKKIFQNKTLQPFSPKSSALSLISSQKRKQGHSMKPTEPSNYRTAESQNNLLSQLFGQKLTSFKIPLRRDITE
ncbi:zinc finger 469 [Pelobates cultripes]|uniref:Zinc finger 469 n=1 Tax=Pelobates cultripes TaxID=61616 RepID=A0AAD1TFH6_PELCU|nr:zinc finger 469 [Pelobates cultripes]